MLLIAVFYSVNTFHPATGVEKCGQFEHLRLNDAGLWVALSDVPVGGKGLVQVLLARIQAHHLHVVPNGSNAALCHILGE